MKLSVCPKHMKLPVMPCDKAHIQAANKRKQWLASITYTLLEVTWFMEVTLYMQCVFPTVIFCFIYTPTVPPQESVKTLKTALGCLRIDTLVKVEALIQLLHSSKSKRKYKVLSLGANNFTVHLNKITWILDLRICSSTELPGSVASMSWPLSLFSPHISLLPTSDNSPTYLNRCFRVNYNRS